MFTHNYKNFQVGTALCAIAMLSPLTVQAGVIVKEKTNFYDVSGATGKQIFRKFGVNKVSKGNSLHFGGRHAIASTDFVVEVKNIKKAIVANNCRITNANVLINVTYSLPRWTDAQKASPNMRNEWSKFMDYVIWHERHHVKLAKDFAKKYLALIKETRYPALANCSSMPKEAKNKLKKLVKFHKRTQQAFDRAENLSGGKSRETQNALRRAY